MDHASSPNVLTIRAAVQGILEALKRQGRAETGHGGGGTSEEL